MIYYRSDGVWGIVNIFRWSGSVYPTACLAAFPCACIAAGMRALLPSIWDDEESDWVLTNNSLWASFSSLLGFLIVFRTSQAYNRFWAGCTALHRIKADWFDACSALVAFCKFTEPSEVSIDKIRLFEHTIVRLFSMLYTLALAEIEDSNTVEVEEVRAFSYEFVGAQDFDLETMFVVKDCDSKVELVYQWIQQLIVEHLGSTGRPNVLEIPAPILSRVFQLLSNGMNAFHDGVQVSSVPFPFPYAQCCSCLLAIHWLLVPLVACGWSPSWWIAFVFTFLQVFILWALNTTAVEIENPFGSDDNDLDGRGLQSQMNRHLEILLDDSTMKTPGLSSEWARMGTMSGKAGLQASRVSMKEMWSRSNAVSNFDGDVSPDNSKALPQETPSHFPPQRKSKKRPTSESHEIALSSRRTTRRSTPKMDGVSSSSTPMNFIDEGASEATNSLALSASKERIRRLANAGDIITSSSSPVKFSPSSLSQRQEPTSQDQGYSNGHCTRNMARLAKEPFIVGDISISDPGTLDRFISGDQEWPSIEELNGVHPPLDDPPEPLQPTLGSDRNPQGPLLKLSDVVAEAVRIVVEEPCISREADSARAQNFASRSTCRSDVRAAISEAYSEVCVPIPAISPQIKGPTLRPIEPDLKGGDEPICR